MCAGHTSGHHLCRHHQVRRGHACGVCAGSLVLVCSEARGLAQNAGTLLQLMRMFQLNDRRRATMGPWASSAQYHPRLRLTATSFFPAEVDPRQWNPHHLPGP